MGTSKPSHPEKCNYKDGPCEEMAKFSHPGASPTGKGIFAMSNMKNFNIPGKMYHKGFFFRSDFTEKNGVMLDFCPWCGADLGEWLSAYYDELGADYTAWKEQNPNAEKEREKKKALRKQEEKEFLEGLEPKVRTALKRLSETQREALQEAWVHDGRFLHGSGIHARTIESICSPERGLVDKGRKLNPFGIRVREAASEFEEYQWF